MRTFGTNNRMVGLQAGNVYITTTVGRSRKRERS